MKAYNCPICGQSGLSDFKKQHTSCPQCNSDLKPFMLLSTITKTDKRRNRLSLILIVSSVMMVVVSSLFIKREIAIEKEFELAKYQIDQLKDSLVSVNNSNKSLSNKILGIETQAKYVKYVVKKGDFPWKIAEFFYGDGRKYVLIEKENNLNQPYILQVGQVLLIKIIE